VKPPNPGSDEAISAGCTCPVMDNNRGTRAPYPPDGWWMVEGCPVHRPASQEGWGRSEH
jgi:hypothetical protein